MRFLSLWGRTGFVSQMYDADSSLVVAISDLQAPLSVFDSGAVDIFGFGEMLS